jgi:arylsulfatase A-like enzyme
MRVVAASLCLLAVCACARQAQRPNLLLITVDTLRADHVGSYGYARDTTPNLDALAAQGLRFTRAGSPRAKTTPAMASLLSGTYPHEHGVRDLASPLAPDVPLFAERLRGAGYSTGALVGNWVLGDSRSGLARGFELWSEWLPDVVGVPPHDAPQRGARSLTDGALVALGLAEPPADPAFEPRRALVREGRPWFLWLHYMDPHGAYDPPAEARVFESEGIERLPELDESQVPRTQPPHPPRVAEYNVPPEARLPDGGVDVARVRDLYDGEIRYVDRELGRLVDALRAAGLLDDTLLVVTADHGESLGEHRYWFEHGMYAYENTCRVPLIVRLPAPAGAAPPQGVREGEISLADLAPTLLDVLDLPPLPGAPEELRGAPRGRSRRALLDSDRPVSAPIFCEKVERAERAGVVQSKAVRLGDWKLIRRYAARDDPARLQERELVLLGEELFDLAADPLEAANLAAAPPAAAPLDVLRRELERFTAADRELVDMDRILQRQRERLEHGDPEVLRVLEALGY